MEGITSQWLMNKMTSENKILVTKEDLIPSILASDARIIVTIGAGDLGEMVPSIKNALYETI
jgi:UDP-N-acetylmuramate--alanine ligase